MTLTKRLSEATEGTRELDELIARHLAGDPKDPWFDLFGVWTSDDTAPMVSRSLDAALALAERVLPGWTADCDATVPEMGIDWSLHEPVPDGVRITGSGRTHALALCLAILKATASPDTGEGG